MAYLTESTLNNIIDHPIALSSTDLRMGDWVVVSVLRVVTPMRLTYRMCNISISASSVDTSLISSGNKLYGNNGLATTTRVTFNLTGALETRKLSASKTTPDCITTGVHKRQSKP